MDRERIDAFVGTQVKRHGIPGLAIGVVDHGRTIMTRGYGAADSTGRAVTGRTPFVLASVSKTLTATALMQLVDEGRVDLDAPVQTYLPRFRVADPAASKRITVRNLLTHTSGLPASGCERDVTTLRAFVADLREVSLDSEPGARFIYCSGNYNVLGRVVEQVSGEPFGVYVQRHVFAPLGMTRSFTSQAAARSDGLAQGHRWLFGEITPMEHYNPSSLPSGYLISTAQDMCRFLAASMNGGRYSRARLLSTRALTAMQSPQVSAGDGTTYGLGWRQGHLGGVPAVYHFGENYNAETLAFMEPTTGRGAVILINSQGLLATPAFRSIENGVARLLAGQDPDKSVVPVRTVYLGFDTLVLVSLTLALLPLIRARRWAGTAGRRPGGTLRRTRLRIVAELAAPVLVLLGTRLVIGMIGATWREMFLLVPDVIGWLWALCVTVFATGLIHAAIAARHSGHRAQHGANTGPDPSETAAKVSMPLP